VSAILYESVARIARHEAGARATAGIGRVVDTFAAPEGAASPDHAVSVEMRDSGLVLPRVPVAVGAMGLAAMPAVDDLVVVLFLHGDYHAPVVVGRIYSSAQAPPQHDAGQIVLRLPASSSQPKLNLEVEGDGPLARLVLPDDVSLEVTGEKVVVKVGDLQLSLDSAGGGRVEVSAGGSTITLKKDGDVKISAKGKLVLEGTEVSLSGTSKVKISGAQVEVN
jgi:phage baseplate assembly protein gpV